MSKNKFSKSKQAPTIYTGETFYYFQLQSQQLAPVSGKSYNRLWQDDQTAVIAGTLITAWTLSVGLCHLVS